MPTKTKDKIKMRHAKEPLAQIVEFLPSHYLQENGFSLGMQHILALLRAHTTHDFSFYKPTLIRQCIEKNMQSHCLSTLMDYVGLLLQHPDEITSLFQDILIGVTHFFRDAEAFSILKQRVLPNRLQRTPANDTLRVWAPGCSTGEEVYSIAMLIREYLDETKHHRPVQLFGTDINLKALNIARAGKYPASLCADITPERLQRFFVKEKNTYQVKEDIKEMVFFWPHNIVTDLPFSKLDLICCRNVLIYFNTRLQQSLLARFYHSLKPKGVLFLGQAETVTDHENLFRPINKKWKLFERKKASILPLSWVMTQASFHPDTLPTNNLSLSDICKLSRLTNNRILNKNIRKINPQPLNEKHDNLAESANKKYYLTGPASYSFPDTHTLRYPSSPDTSSLSTQTLYQRILALECELQYNKQILKTTLEERQAAIEKLQTVHEAFNVSQDALRYLNEELIAVNIELQRKIDQLASLHNGRNILKGSHPLNADIPRSTSREAIEIEQTASRIGSHTLSIKRQKTPQDTLKNNLSLREQ